MTVALQRETVEGYLTYAQIQERVQNRIDDADDDVLIVIKDVIQDVYNDILSRYKDSQIPPQWLIDYDGSLSTTASNRTTPLVTPYKDPDRILKVSIQANNSWYPCWPILLSDLEEKPDRYWNTTNTQRPNYFFHRKEYAQAGGEVNYLDWFYLPDDDYTFRYWFTKRIPPLENNDDVPMLPIFAQSALIYGTLVELAMFDIKIKVGPWAELYERRLKRLDGWSNNFVTYPMERPLRGV